MNLYFFISLSDAKRYTIFSTDVILYFGPFLTLCVVLCRNGSGFVDFDRSVCHSYHSVAVYFFSSLLLFDFCNFVMCDFFFFLTREQNGCSQLQCCWQLIASKTI